ncbi:PIG-P [Wolfiporia cocos MD-104 SS10]|uniref:PIG-P n=1 Tax=Wolfiporia cocos (strain MD-104) TaxID=742152 RepID=A0A2H3J9I8_WOLCO|nr:PIG-P [Wolfiporia cocos MD-104 SS10]
MPPPPPAPRRAAEFYGFVAATASTLLFALVLLWALAPDAALRAAGVSWYPSREWAVLLPAYTLVLVLLTYAAYAALALARTPALGDLATLTDARALLPPADPDARASAFLAHARPGALPEMYDVPIGLVNRVVYGRRRGARTERPADGR